MSTFLELIAGKLTTINTKNTRPPHPDLLSTMLPFCIESFIVGREVYKMSC